MINERDANRDATIVALYRGGATMDEIADISGGISRQRVQQILWRNGVSKMFNGEKIDPLHVVAACRKQDVRNFHMAGLVLGISHGESGNLKKVVSQLGMLPAITRLFAWRTRKYRERYTNQRRTELALAYRAFAERLGRIPTITELRPQNGTPFWTIFFKYFESIADVRIAAGCDPTDQRGKARGDSSKSTVCKRGHLFAETRNKYGRCSTCIAMRLSARRARAA